MADEIRQIAAQSGRVREVDLSPDGPLRAACKQPGDMVMRPHLRRVQFASNAPDRNTLFIYETAVIVGIPVTLVSSVAWPYYAETTLDGALDVLQCDDARAHHDAAALRLRSEGRGFVRTRTLRDEQLEAATRGLTRKLLSRSFAEMAVGGAR